MSKVAVVTGANKGIGYAIVRGLCKQFSGDVILTARDVERGKAAILELEKEGLKPKFFQLEITNTESCEKLGEFLKQEYGGLDILVNNAGMAYKQAATEPPAVQAENSINCNYFGTMKVCDALFPLLRPHARVVNVCSRAGMLGSLKNTEVKHRVTSPDLTVDELSKYMMEYIELCKAGKHVEAGWPGSTYGMSKIGEIAFTLIKAREFEKDPRTDIVINACCPGYVSTDMSSFKGTKTIDEGADTPIYLSLLPENTKSPKGCMVAERNILKWD